MMTGALLTGAGFQVTHRPVGLLRQFLLRVLVDDPAVLNRAITARNLHHNAIGAADFLKLPNNSVVELGSKIEI